MSKVNVDEWWNAAGTVQYYGAVAWVNFNGTGTVAIRASKNISSITDNGTGDYVVNFTSALNSADYVMTFGGRYDNGTGVSNITLNQKRGGIMTTTACAVSCQSVTTEVADCDRYTAAFFAS